MADKNAGGAGAGAGSSKEVVGVGSSEHPEFVPRPLGIEQEVPPPPSEVTGSTIDPDDGKGKRKIDEAGASGSADSKMARTSDVLALGLVAAGPPVAVPNQPHPAVVAPSSAGPAVPVPVGVGPPVQAPNMPPPAAVPPPLPVPNLPPPAVVDPALGGPVVDPVLLADPVADPVQLPANIHDFLNVVMPPHPDLASAAGHNPLFQPSMSIGQIASLVDTPGLVRSAALSAMERGIQPIGQLPLAPEHLPAFDRCLKCGDAEATMSFLSDSHRCICQPCHAAIVLAPVTTPCDICFSEVLDNIEAHG